MCADSFASYMEFCELWDVRVQSRQIHSPARRHASLMTPRLTRRLGAPASTIYITYTTRDTTQETAFVNNMQIAMWIRRLGREEVLLLRLPTMGHSAATNNNNHVAYVVVTWSRRRACKRQHTLGIFCNLRFIHCFSFSRGLCVQSVLQGAILTHTHTHIYTDEHLLHCPHHRKCIHWEYTLHYDIKSYSDIFKFAVNHKLISLYLLSTLQRNSTH